MTAVISVTRRLPPGALLAVAWLAVVAVALVAAPWLPLEDPDRPIRGLVNQPPGTDGHLLGGDNLGRDLLARIVFGARSSLLVSIGAVAFGGVVGGALGLVAGYYRGRVDAVLSTIFDAALAIPALVLALTFVTVFSGAEDASYLQRIGVLVLTLGVVSVPVVARVARASTLTWSQREFVVAARGIGTRDGRILRRDIVPNVLPAMLSVALLGIAVVIVAEGGLSILGVGVKDGPSLGNIVAAGRLELRRAPHIVFAPVVVLFLTVMALNHLADAARDRADARGGMRR